jgi:hypothetical protein
VVDNGWVGYLQDVDKEDKSNLSSIAITDLTESKSRSLHCRKGCYINLYQKEAEKQTEHKEERETLNRLYDAFVKKYGNLNSADNIKLIKRTVQVKKSLIWSVSLAA